MGTAKELVQAIVDASEGSYERLKAFGIRVTVDPSGARRFTGGGASGLLTGDDYAILWEHGRRTLTEGSDGVCCACGYTGEEETPCKIHPSGDHCIHWWD